jgi:hypothetical protein
MATLGVEFGKMLLDTYRDPDDLLPGNDWQISKVARKTGEPTCEEDDDNLLLAMKENGDIAAGISIDIRRWTLKAFHRIGDHDTLAHTSISFPRSFVGEVDHDSIVKAIQTATAKQEAGERATKRAARDDAPIKAQPNAELKPDESEVHATLRGFMPAEIEGAEAGFDYYVEYNAKGEITKVNVDGGLFDEDFEIDIYIDLAKETQESDGEFTLKFSEAKPNSKITLKYKTTTVFTIEVPARGSPEAFMAIAKAKVDDILAA